MTNSLSFLAEIHEVKATKQVSSDVEIRAVFKTHQYDVLDLGKFPADRIVRVTVELIPEHRFGESPSREMSVKTDSPTVDLTSGEGSGDVF